MNYKNFLYKTCFKKYPAIPMCGIKIIVAIEKKKQSNQ